MAEIIFTNRALVTMKEAAVSERDVRSVMASGTHSKYHNGYSVLKKYGSYDLYVNYLKKSNGNLITSVKKRANTRNRKAW